MTLAQKSVSSPVGTLRCVASDNALVGVFSETQLLYRNDAIESEDHSILEQTARELAAYFHNGDSPFTVPLAMEGSEFQKSVWAQLLRIPYGETRSYLQIASAIGKPKAVRAVGAANGKNPLGIIVPCHRVIGSKGTLTGYAGGLDMKRWLLCHEGALLL